MRPMFVDTILTEAGFEMPAEDRALRVDRADRADRSEAYRSEAYREWRRTRVLFMHAVSEAERAVVSGVADLPAQRRGADL
jgi:hypothetical protein